VTDLITARSVLSVDGIDFAEFAEADGLPTATAAPKKLPGRTVPPTIVLKRGKNQSLGLRRWYDAAREDSAVAAKGASLVMYRTDGKPVARYHLENAWPSKLETRGRAGAPGAPIKSLTLVCSAISRS
jgi:phage tail-like protein